VLFTTYKRVPDVFNCMHMLCNNISARGAPRLYSRLACCLLLMFRLFLTVSTTKFLRIFPLYSDAGCCRLWLTILFLTVLTTTAKILKKRNSDRRWEWM